MLVMATLKFAKTKMRILTVSPSPYLLTRNGRINKDIMLGAEKVGHQVESVVWHHDVQHFMATETGKHLFGNHTIYPFLGQKGELPAFLFETMKTSQPNVLISIGDYDDTDFVWSIKSLYPHLFKWVAIIPTGTDFVHERNRMALSYADHVIVTTESALRAFEGINRNIELIPYGPCHETFYDLSVRPLEISALCMGKNVQSYNVPAFIKAVGQSGIKGALHTNLDDGGDYDIRGLLKRFGAKNLTLPNKYVSVREGLSNTQLNELYNSHHLIVDCSLQNATAITMLEAMSTGCLPVGMNVGAVGEVLSRMPAEFRFVVPHETFLGPKEEEFAIISTKELYLTLENIRKDHISNKDWRSESERITKDIARIFSKEIFVKRVNKSLEMAVNGNHKIAVDTF